MSLHKANINWSASEPFSHLGYNKDHTALVSGQSLKLSSANEPEHIDPEQALAMSLASCHMLTFLALCAKKRLVVRKYEDNPVAEVKKNPEGKSFVENIQLNPKAEFEGKTPTPEELEKIHHKAHEHCFISNSLISEVHINV